MTMNTNVTTCLWFESQGFNAALFYVELIPNSRMLTNASANENPMIVDFELSGTPYRIINGGAHYKLSPACSIAVTTPDQPETDRIWNALIADGGEEGRCGWLVDRWGVSWQVIPSALMSMMGASDREAAKRAQDAMMAMGKIDISQIEAAFQSK